MKAKRTYETNSIIVTAFEPWRKRKKNISLEVLKNIIEKNIQGVSCLALPTIFSDFKTEIDYIKNFKPDCILSLGESGNKKIELEKKLILAFEMDQKYSNLGMEAEKLLNDTLFKEQASLTFEQLKNSLAQKKDSYLILKN